MGWSSRSGPQLPTTSTNQPQSSSSPLDFISKLNPFTKNNYQRIRLATGDYDDNGGNEGETLPTQLPAPTRSEEQGGYFALSRWDRILVFAACLAGAVVCFVVAFVLLPVLAFKPRKFAVLWTVGSLLVMISFGFLNGFTPYIRHLLSQSRLPFTIAYFASMFLTLYFAVGLHNLILTVITSVIQIGALISFFVSYVVCCS